MVWDSRVSDQGQSTAFQLSVFKTPLGWFGLLGQGGRLLRIHIGQPTKQAAMDAFRDEVDGADMELTSWNPDLERRLFRFANGELVDFSDVELTWPRPLSDFRRKVIEHTRKLGWGETTTYGDLAERAGSPRAARAVGSTMATNRFPIIVPCHRVVGSAGGLRGFNAPTGVNLKRQLLSMEADSLM